MWLSHEVSMLAGITSSIRPESLNEVAASGQQVCLLERGEEFQPGGTIDQNFNQQFLVSVLIPEPISGA